MIPIINEDLGKEPAGSVVLISGLKKKGLQGHPFVILSEGATKYNVAMITSLSNYDEKRFKKYSGEKIILKDYKDAGLDHPSIVSLNVRGSVAKDQIRRTLGQLSKEDWSQVQEKYKVVRIQNVVEDLVF